MLPTLQRKLRCGTWAKELATLNTSSAPPGQLAPEHDAPTLGHVLHTSNTCAHVDLEAGSAPTAAQEVEEHIELMLS